MKKPGLCNNLKGWEVGGRFNREGTCVYLWLIHVDLWQKSTQHCKAIILQLKINLKKKRMKILKEKSLDIIDVWDPSCLWTSNYEKYYISLSCLIWVRFSSIAQSCPTLCNPTDCSTPGLPVHHQLLEFTQTHVYWVSDAIQASHPLSSLSPPTFNLSQHQGLFKWVSSLHQVAKALEFQLQHQSFQWTLRTDFL